MPSDCPICMEELETAEEVYRLPCDKCDYNFCTNCVDEFLRSSKDDYQEASDGSNQVKVHIACPQCRSKYGMDISDLLLLRKASKLAASVTDKDSATILQDSELSASQLAAKRDFGTDVQRRKDLLCAHTTFCKVSDLSKLTDDQLRALEQAKIDWTKLFGGLAWDENDDDGGGVDGRPGDGEANAGSAKTKGGNKRNNNSSNNKNNNIDLTLFMGLEDCMGQDEQVFVTQLLTSGDTHKLNQAALILNGILKMPFTSASAPGRPARSTTTKKLTMQQQQRLLESKERTKKLFPLPNHMPGYFIVQCFPRNRRFITFQNIMWDGAMTPPVKMKRVWNKIYEDYDLPKEPRACVSILGVRGPCGRLGLRKHDIVTHVNDMEWTGTAEELQEYIWQQPVDSEITISTNSNSETASFLKWRNQMLTKSKVELI